MRILRTNRYPKSFSNSTDVRKSHTFALEFDVDIVALHLKFFGSHGCMKPYVCIYLGPYIA